MLSEQVRPFPSASAGPATGLVLRILKRIEFGSLRVAHGDCEWLRKGSNPGPESTLQLHNPARLLSKVLLRGDIGFAESYMHGDWDSPNLAALLLLLAQNEQALSAQSRSFVSVNWLNRLRHRINRNSIRGSRRNIAAHYDLGNEFYRLWLDPSMTYSSALFAHGERDLERAQQRKYDRLLDLLEAKPGQRVLEIGCGWGGFALQAAKRGLRVTGITFSREQLAFARGRLSAAGMAESVDLRLQDYRHLSDRYDHIVSIEMLEAVGEENWDTYTRTLRRCLKPGGRAALQFITIDDSAFEGYRRNPEFIQRYIFPGGMLPTLPRFRASVEKSGLRMVRTDLFGEDYARTLAEWHRRFQKSEPEVKRMGFEERFRRMWTYYLQIS
ncbi:MAG: cyclopropane-fatty-acyl-phospholipid synthase family protein [Desulfobacterales bacterium]